MGNSKSQLTSVPPYESQLQGCGNRPRTSHSGGFYPHISSERCQSNRRSARMSSSGIYPHRTFIRTSEPIGFHRIHGVNISVTEYGKVATRTNSFCYAIAFTSRSLAAEERINIKLKTVERGWSGVMRFGFTSHDPASLSPDVLPRYACPDLTNLPGYWAKALPEKFAKQDNILTFYVNLGGSVVYLINDIEQGVLFDGVDVTVPIWVMVDVYGNTTSLKIINKNQSTIHSSISSAEAIEEASGVQSVISLPPDMEQAVQAIFELSEPISPIGFSLTMGPSLHCRNRKLMSRKGNFDSCIAFTNTALKPGDTLYMYCAEGKPNNSGFLESLGWFGIGITTCDPSTIHISELPLDAADLLDRPEYWIIVHEFEPPEEKEYFALKVEHGGFLSYKRQSQQNKETLFHLDISQPLYLVFNMHSKVSALAIVGMTSSPASIEYLDAEPMSFALEDNLEMFGGLSGTSASIGRRVTFDDAYSILNSMDGIFHNTQDASRPHPMLPESRGATSLPAVIATPEPNNVTNTSPAHASNSETNIPGTSRTEDNEPGEAEPGEVSISSNEGRRGLSMGELAGISAPVVIGALSWLGNRMVNRLSRNDSVDAQAGTTSSSSSSSNSSGDNNIENEEENDEFYVAAEMESSSDSSDSDMEDQLHTNARLLDMFDSELRDLLPHLQMMSSSNSEETLQTQQEHPASDRTESISTSVKEEVEPEQDGNAKPTEECVICYDAKVNAVIYTCGHACMCYECGKKFLRQRRKKCPICRADIKDIIKIFHS